MSSIHHSIIAALVPSLVKRVVLFVAKKFKLTEFDALTKARVRQQVYPAYYGFLYGLWLAVLLMVGFAVLAIFFLLASRFPERVSVYLFLGIINMIGAWLVLGALLDAVFWHISSKLFRDYVSLRLIQSGSGYPVEQQISALLKLGLVYYLIFAPINYILAR